jgi:hypothetical protein
MECVRSWASVMWRRLARWNTLQSSPHAIFVHCLEFYCHVSWICSRDLFLIRILKRWIIQTFYRIPLARQRPKARPVPTLGDRRTRDEQLAAMREQILTRYPFGQAIRCHLYVLLALWGVCWFREVRNMKCLCPPKQWDCGFESTSRHKYLLLIFYVVVYR